MQEETSENFKRKGVNVPQKRRALLAAQEERQAETHQDGRAPVISQRQAVRQSAPGHPSLQGPAHASAVGHQPATLARAVRVSATGAAPFTTWRPTARSSRSSRPIWIWLTCLATPSGPASAKPFARTSRKPQPGLSGNTKPTLSPPSPQEPPSTNRGAEQGDVLGTIQSALVLGQARDAHRWEFLSNTTEDKGVCDEWFVDDGQVFVCPSQFDPFLRVLNGALATFGATRGCAVLGNVKSSARLLCPPAPARVSGLGHAVCTRRHR